MARHVGFWHKAAVAAAVLVPPLALAAWVGQIVWQERHAVEVDLPIEGYDPRDLLSGHYLLFRVVYPVNMQAFCTTQDGDFSGDVRTGYLCLDENRGQASFERPADCQKVVSGQCMWGNFNDGLERFYIPEEVNAQALEKAVIEKRGSVTLRFVAGRNKPRIHNLKIDGTDWRQWLRQRP